MRHEGARYGVPAEPNLNKVVLEREGAVSDDHIEALLQDAIAATAPGLPLLKVEPRVRESVDLPDRPCLALGVLDLDLRVNGDVGGETQRVAREILEHCGGSWRSNKNVAMLIAADFGGMAKAKGSARALAALRDLSGDKHRLGRFNTEQREQLVKRLSDAEA